MGTEVFLDCSSFPSADLLYFSSRRRIEEYIVITDQKQLQETSIPGGTYSDCPEDCSVYLHSSNYDESPCMSCQTTSFSKTKGGEHRARWTQWPATTLTHLIAAVAEKMQR